MLIYKRLAGILSLGNINFVQKTDSHDYAEIDNQDEILLSSKLLDVDSGSLHRALIERPILQERYVS